MKHVFLAAALATASLAAPVQANTVGQPFLTIEAEDISRASLLNLFEGNFPSDLLETTLTGTISSAIGAPNLVGAAFSLSTSLFGSSELTLDSMTLTEDFLPDGTFFDGEGLGIYDPFQAGPGDLNYLLYVEPSFSEPPPFETFFFSGPWEPFGPTSTSDDIFPGFNILVSVFLDGPLPTKIFEPDTFNFEYIEGALPVDRIEIGRVGGAPLPPAPPPIPLPASLPLLMAGLAGMGLLRRFSRRP